VPDAFRVLLVDDSETVTEMLSWLLGSAGYAIETASDGVGGCGPLSGASRTSW
jgi:CheY-like chemotaxis protein